ncbi:hypothetical protein JCM10213_004389 [Rhodosporidiobolus nylandii]
MSAPINLAASPPASSPADGAYGSAIADGGSEFGSLLSRSVGTGGAAAGGKGKKAKGKQRSEGYGPSPIASLPLELLAHIFAHLPPRALGDCQLVCREWHDVVGDEGSWRTAFETYFDVTPESLGRRLETASWRSEYIARVGLLRQWHRSRTGVVQHNPSLGALSAMHISLPASSPAPARPSRSDSPTLTASTLLSISLPLGAALHTTPFTGKLSRRPLLSSPIDHLGRPIGLPIIPCTSFALSFDGARLVWGMRDGSLRFSNASAPAAGGRGTPGGALEQGEVRELEPGQGHREGCPVLALAFSNAGGTGGGKVLKGLKQRTEVFASAATDGTVALWSCAVQPAQGAAPGERTPPAVRLWQGRWDVALDALPSAAVEGAPQRPRTRPTLIALDAGWVGRHHGRPASLAVGRSDGKVVVFPRIELDDEKRAVAASLEPGAGAANGEEVIVLEPAKGEQGEVDYLVLDPPSSSEASLALLVHQKGAAHFSRYDFPSPSAASSAASTPSPPPVKTVFGHPAPAQLSALTALAVDFDPPPAVVVPQSQPGTPGGEVKLSFLPPTSSLSLSRPSSLSRGSSTLSLPPPSPSLPLPAPSGANRFGRRKYVAAGDAEGRVYLWDWQAQQGDEERERGDVVEPSVRVQGLEVEEGRETGKVTALEVGEVGVFVGGLDGTLRLYSPLSTSSAPAPVRTFRDRTAPRHPRGALAAGLIPADEEERWLVSHIRASRDAVVAAIGGRVLAWRVAGAEEKKKKAVGAGAKMTARQERFKANLEHQREVRESISALSAESAARLEAHEDARRRTSQFGLPPSLGNMTEEEAVAFATMLSLDDAEASMFSEASAREDGEWEQLPEEWAESDSLGFDEDFDRSRAPTSGTRWQEASDEENDHFSSYAQSQATSRGASRRESLSTSLSVPSSPFLRGSSFTSPSPMSASPSRTSNHTWTPVSPSLLAVGSPPSAFSLNGKVQVSPRLGPTYGMNGALHSNDQVPDMDPALWPVASSPPAVGASPLLSGSRRPSMAGGASPSPAAVYPATSSTPSKRGWSDVARTPGPSSSPSPARRPSSSCPPIWPSPSLGASYTPPPKPTASSLLAEQLRSSELSAREEAAARRAQREQEELDLAIALSLSQAEQGVEGLEL